MRLLMYQDERGPNLGVVRADQIVDLQRVAVAARREHPPATLMELIGNGPRGLDRLEVLLALVDRRDGSDEWVRPLADTTILPPLAPPRGNVLAIGRNYGEHARESARATGETVLTPTIFTKAQTSVNGPYDDIPLHTSLTQQVDYEVELGVIIGPGGVDISRADALNHVFGYTVVNDVSARDVQYGMGGQFFKGKSLDGFCPFGPWVVTADEISDPQDLHLWLRVNGETRQDAYTREMIFPVDELIAQLSAGMTLLPGSLIATGTPAGVGMGRTPPEFLKPGDVVEAGIDGIGELRNHMIG